jgi:hypothetical protein
MSCNQKEHVGEDKIEVQHIEFTSEEDMPEPPSPGFTSKFKSLQEWLLNICDTENPKNAHLTYNFGLFESPNEYILVLTGVNKYDKDQYNSITRIEFEPANMYFTLPANQYKGLTLEQVRERLSIQLKDFTKTEKFRQSFFQEAKSITTDWKGEIWKGK